MSTRAFFLIVIIIFNVCAVDSYAKSGGKILLECSYNAGKETGSDQFIVDTKNKTIENVSTGELYDVKEFNEHQIFFEFHYEQINISFNISRKTGLYNQYGNFGNENWNFNGTCKNKPMPKPLF